MFWLSLWWISFVARLRLARLSASTWLVLVVGLPAWVWYRTHIPAAASLWGWRYWARMGLISRYYDLIIACGGREWYQAQVMLVADGYLPATGSRLARAGVWIERHVIGRPALAAGAHQKWIIVKHASHK